MHIALILILAIATLAWLYARARSATPSLPTPPPEFYWDNVEIDSYSLFHHDDTLQENPLGNITMVGLGTEDTGLFYLRVTVGHQAYAYLSPEKVLAFTYDDAGIALNNIICTPELPEAEGEFYHIGMPPVSLRPSNCPGALYVERPTLELMEGLIIDDTQRISPPTWRFTVCTHNGHDARVGASDLARTINQAAGWVAPRPYRQLMPCG